MGAGVSFSVLLDMVGYRLEYFFQGRAFTQSNLQTALAVTQLIVCVHKHVCEVCVCL